MAAEPSDRPHVSWPKVLGILMIIFGSLGILCNVGSAYTTYNFRGLRILQDMATKAGSPAPFTAEQLEFLNEPLMRNWNMVTTAYLCLSAVLAIVLLGAGIGLISRHAWAVRLAMTWAGLKIVLELANAAANWIVQQKILHAVDAGMIKADAVPKNLLGTSVAALVGQVAIGIAFAVFVLIWLSLPSTKEETAHWA